MENKNQKTGDHVRDLISAFMDGELPARQEAAVQRHLDECPVCRKEYEAMTSVDHLLRGMSTVAPSADFSRNFWKKVDAGEARMPRGLMGLMGLFRSWRPVLAASASALVIVVAGSVFLYHSGSDNNDAVMPGIADNMTFYGDYEIVRNLELFENWEEIASLEEI